MLSLFQNSLYLIIKLVYMVFKINVAADHSAILVGLIDQLDDSPFILFITLYSYQQNLCVLDDWEIQYLFAELLGDMPTAPYFFNLILLFKSQHIESKGGIHAYWRLAKWTRGCSGFISQFYSIFLVLFVTYSLCIS